MNMTRFLKSLAPLAALAIAATVTTAAEPKKLLLVTATAGFHHTSTASAEEILPEMGKKSGAFEIVGIVRSGPRPKDKAEGDAWTEKMKQDFAEKMSTSALKSYDGVIFANTTGILPLPDKEAFLAWIKSGKAFIGMHSASDTFHAPDGKVDPYIEMLGGEFQTHKAQAGVECLVQDMKHPATKALGEAYCIEVEEIYLFKNYDPARVHELLILDKHPNDKKQLGHFAVAWCKKHGDGNVFYTSLGHREDVWDNKRYQQHILGGIKWALGLEPGEASPQLQAR
jgi:hypothetical protein